ncbi:MAG: STAS domain-containing protein [Candidatus Marinimicrobia bacterium]|nr:STAS domain-containing protein [Candidatus Neomarinimicrobiota bacterium]
MRIKKSEKDGVTILTLSGKMMLDAKSASLHDCVKDLIKEGKTKVVMDMGKITWFGSTGLGALLASYTSLKDNNGDLKVARATRKIRSVFMFTQIIKVLENYDTVDEAVASIK